MGGRSCTYLISRGPGAMGQAVLVHRSSEPSKMGVPMNMTLMEMAPAATSRSLGGRLRGLKGGRESVAGWCWCVATRVRLDSTQHELRFSLPKPTHPHATTPCTCSALDGESDLAADQGGVGRELHVGRLERGSVRVARVPRKRCCATAVRQHNHSCQAPHQHIVYALTCHCR